MDNTKDNNTQHNNDQCDSIVFLTLRTTAFSITKLYIMTKENYTQHTNIQPYNLQLTARKTNA
jgi:hypothetical protein